MKLSEFYKLAALRAKELNSKYWAVEAKIETCDISSVSAKYVCYMPEAAHGHQSAGTASEALRLIGALPPLEIDDDTELSGIEGTG